MSLQAQCISGKKSPHQSLSHLFWGVYVFIFERERERERVRERESVCVCVSEGGAEREGDKESEAGSRLPAGAQSLTQSSNSRTVKS